jgi:hypothetical protein
VGQETAMPQQPVQIFMSYAWKDNTVPPGDPSAKKGFAAALAGQIEYWFDLANPKPKLWWDRDNVDDAQQFRSSIKQAIDQSSFFLIVLSDHWLGSQFCQKELQLFRQRWQHEEEFDFKHRIILAHQTYISKEAYPDLLPEQRGLQFFSLSGLDRTVSPFYHRGKGTEEFYAMADDLAQILIKRAKHEIWEPPPPPPSPKGPKVYLAKPAPDMREHYLRLHKELLERGYNVVPGVSDEIPLDPTETKLPATEFIDNALVDARVSVHVLGKSAGPAPVDLEHIVKLQLAKTADKVAATETGSPESRRFSRIVWAPRIFADAKGPTLERDPIETFKSFGRQLSSDRIEGDSISPFVEFLLQHLRSLESPDEPQPPDPSQPDGQIYICHSEADTGYAIELADLLEQNNINYVMPVYYKTSELERRQFHKESLSECSAVMMCWANASEMWARAQSRELRDWRKLGRKQQFACRGLIAGPPPDARKDDRLLRHLFPPKDIDVVLNWTDADKPSPEVIRKIFAAETNAR